MKRLAIGLLFLSPLAFGNSQRGIILQDHLQVPEASLQFAENLRGGSYDEVTVGLDGAVTLKNPKLIRGSRALPFDTFASYHKGICRSFGFDDVLEDTVYSSTTRSSSERASVFQSGQFNNKLVSSSNIVTEITCANSSEYRIAATAGGQVFYADSRPFLQPDRLSFYRNNPRFQTMSAPEEVVESHRDYQFKTRALDIAQFVERLSTSLEPHLNNEDEVKIEEIRRQAMRLKNRILAGTDLTTVKNTLYYLGVLIDKSSDVFEDQFEIDSLYQFADDFQFSREEIRSLVYFLNYEFEGTRSELY